MTGDGVLSLRKRLNVIKALNIRCNNMFSLRSMYTIIYVSTLLFETKFL